MGNITSIVESLPVVGKYCSRNQIDYQKFDDMSKSDIITYLRENKIRRFNQSDNTYNTAIKSVDIKNDTLIGMAIELYLKLNIKLNDQDKNSSETTFKKYVKPKFNKESFLHSLEVTFENINKLNITDEIKLNKELVTIINEYIPKEPSQAGQEALPDKSIEVSKVPTYDMVIDEPKIKFNTSNINLDEFNSAFNDNIVKVDMMGISKKMLLDCSHYVKLKLINEFNMLLNNQNQEDIKEISFGKGSFVYKSSKGSVDDINSFRQVIGIPNICSHYHRILSIRLDQYFQKNMYIDTTIQKGGVAGIKSGIFEQILKLKSVVKQANKQKQELCVMFIDIKNAFPSINLAKLLTVLAKYHVDPKIISYIRSYYTNFEYYVQTSEWSTETNKWTTGLVQGCPMSPILFVVLVNYVLVHLSNKYKNKCSFKINDTQNILFTAYIDDISIITKDAESMREVYEELVSIFADFNLIVNKKKTAIFHINPTKEFTLDIEKVSKYKYLGEYIYADGETEKSFKGLKALVRSKLAWLDKSKYTNEMRCKVVTSKVIPYIQKKFMVLYDVDPENKKDVLKIVNTFLDKWSILENNIQMEIRFNFKDKMKGTTDEVLKNIEFDEDVDYIDDNDNNNNVKLSDIKFDYHNNLDHEVENLGDDDKNSEKKMIRKKFNDVHSNQPVIPVEVKQDIPVEVQQVVPVEVPQVQQVVPVEVPQVQQVVPIEVQQVVPIEVQQVQQVEQVSVPSHNENVVE
jgi:hypothetical protein